VDVCGVAASAGASLPLSKTICEAATEAAIDAA
jgi:hypothetical protein